MLWPQSCVWFWRTLVPQIFIVVVWEVSLVGQSAGGRTRGLTPSFDTQPDKPPSRFKVLSPWAWGHQSSNFGQFLCQPSHGQALSPVQFKSENLSRIGAWSTPRAQVTYLHVVVPVMAMTYTKCPEKNTLWQEKNSFLKSNFLWTLGIVFINVWIMYHGYRMSQIKVLNVYLSCLVLNIWEFCNWSGCFYMNEPWITINFQLF